MISTFAVSNYRSLKKIITPLSNLTVVTGPNGSGKSNLYRSLRLLSDAANGHLVSALAKEGGIASTLWAGPETFSKSMLSGQEPVQGGSRTRPVRLEFGFAGERFGYCISLGLPSPGLTMFNLDPIIKREFIWAGPAYRSASCLVERQGAVVKVREGRRWRVYTDQLSQFDSILTELADPLVMPEVFHLRDMIRSWRFYDQFRTDMDSPIRQPQIGTFTPVLDHQGHGLVAALQTIIEVGDREGLDEAINDAFPGARITVSTAHDGRFVLEFHQQGLLRPLHLSELSEGTLRYLLSVAVLLTPRPPSMIVLNEPETSLHPDLLPALGRLIIKASKHTQLWVVSHATKLVATLEQGEECHSISLDKRLGETLIRGQGLLEQPAWHWPR
ncbi:MULTISPECIES: AAA family ATPase [Vibrio]|uniref:AAA family ATPase n=1 Tax=Vibrio TaxID=662 RepID=UPI00354F215A